MPGQSLHITNGDKEADFLILQGKPINEPIASLGPFVMNSEEGIALAYKDFATGKYGEINYPL